MRPILFCGSVLTITVFAGDIGVPPRGSGADYPAHGSVNAAVIAAAIVPSDQAAQMFSSQIAKAGGWPLRNGHGMWLRGVRIGANPGAKRT